jgi:hypothetical protein
MRLLDRTAKTSSAFLGLNCRIAEAEAKAKYPGLAAPAAEDEMHVFLNSPITVGSPESPPPTPSQEVPVSQQNPSARVAAAPWWQKALISAALIAGGAGVGSAIPWLLGAWQIARSVSPPATFLDTNTQYELQIAPASEPPIARP